MRNFAIQLRRPAIVSALIMLPFVSLEVINRRQFDEDFPFPLLGMLWVVTMAFIATLLPLARTQGIAGGENTLCQARAPDRLAPPDRLALGGIVVDQLPCFLGVPNCD